MKILFFFLLVSQSIGLMNPIKFRESSSKLHSHIVGAQSSPSTGLWIVGAGTLGTEVAKEWKNRLVQNYQKDCSERIICETNSNSRHVELNGLGAECRLRSSRSESDQNNARNVLIALPPTSYSNEQYLSELEAACDLWAGPESGGTLLFISSTAVYGDAPVTVSESSPLDREGNPRTKLMISAEDLILRRRGCVLRLAGLYNARRGAHEYWMQRGVVEGSEEGIINLLHYEDASRASLAALAHGEAGSAYLAYDGSPLSRLQICQAAVSSGLYPAHVTLPKFTGSSMTATGKRCDDSVTRKKLGWIPKYPSFKHFMESVRDARGGSGNSVRESL